MNYLVAVSGGVDSVVLLEKLAKEGGHTLVVAHFDHGIRGNSAEDTMFVAGLAKRYNLQYETRREELGPNASEELARERRYLFLREMAAKHDAVIVTAHHMNDIAETIAINLVRGTGWRGVAVLSSDIYRPLLDLTKREIIAYAKQNNLEWREDSTNSSEAYLRNRLRMKLQDEDLVRQLAALRARQVELRDAIDAEVSSIIESDEACSRYFLTNIPEVVALEILRGLAVKKLGRGLVRPQLERALLAIKTARPGAIFPFGDATMRVEKKAFSLSVNAPRKMV